MPLGGCTDQMVKSYKEMITHVAHLPLVWDLLSVRSKLTNSITQSNDKHLRMSLMQINQQIGPRPDIKPGTHMLGQLPFHSAIYK